MQWETGDRARSPSRRLSARHRTVSARLRDCRGCCSTAEDSAFICKAMSRRRRPSVWFPRWLKTIPSKCKESKCRACISNVRRRILSASDNRPAWKRRNASSKSIGTSSGTSYCWPRGSAPPAPKAHRPATRLQSRFNLWRCACGHLEELMIGSRWLEAAPASAVQNSICPDVFASAQAVRDPGSIWREAIGGRPFAKLRGAGSPEKRIAPRFGKGAPIHVGVS